MSLNSDPNSEPSNAELAELARTIAAQFEKLHQENAERDLIVMQRVNEIHASAIQLANDLVTMTSQRSEIVTKSARRAAWLTERTARIVMGSVVLVLVTVWVVTVADPADLADTIRRLLPVLGVIWTGYIAILLGLKPPSIPTPPPPPPIAPSPGSVPGLTSGSDNDAVQSTGGRQ